MSLSRSLTRPKLLLALLPQIRRRSLSIGVEHHKNARPSTRGKHEQGQARKRKDAGAEKKDTQHKKQQRKRRRPQREPEG